MSRARFQSCPVRGHPFRAQSWTGRRILGFDQLNGTCEVLEQYTGGDLTAQHRHLVTQDQYLGVFAGRGSRQQHQPPEDAGSDQIEHPQKHKP
jgi:hypothetical protein